LWGTVFKVSLILTAAHKPRLSTFFNNEWRGKGRGLQKHVYSKNTFKFCNEMGTATKKALKSKRKVEPIPKCFKNEKEGWNLGGDPQCCRLLG